MAAEAATVAALVAVATAAAREDASAVAAWVAAFHGEPRSYRGNNVFVNRGVTGNAFVGRNLGNALVGHHFARGYLPVSPMTVATIFTGDAYLASFPGFGYDYYWCDDGSC